MSKTLNHRPINSGVLHGGGVRGSKRRRNVIRGGSLRHMPDVHITDCTELKKVIPDFDPTLEFEYSARELLLVAEKILLLDPKGPKEDPMWLNGQMLRMRQKREIYVGNGTPDPSVEEGLYWRTHPQGRRVNSDENRRNGTTYYK